MPRQGNREIRRSAAKASGARQGCVNLSGPRTVPVRSSLDGSRTFWSFEHPGLFLRAANRDGSRSDQTLAQAAARSLIQSIQASGSRAAVIKMDSINLIRAMQPLANALGAKVLQVKTLPIANEARRSLEAFNRRF